MRWTNLLVLISLIGLLGCTYSRQDVHSPETSKTVDVGGYRLRLLVRGNGTPTVVLESGLGAGVESWTRVRASVAKFTRVVSYDHAGIGGSEPRPKPRTGQQIATELNTALKTAELGPPYVLVGHSIGGPYIHVFASLYPSEVAGMVFVDPTQYRLSQENADVTGWLRGHHPEKVRDMEDKFGRAQLSEGIQDLLRVQFSDVVKQGEEILASAPERLRHQWASIMHKEQLEMMREESLQSLATMPQPVREEFEGMLPTLQQAQAASLRPKFPVVVLANSKRDSTLTPAEQALEGVRIERRLESYREWLRKLPSGKLMVTDKSGHDIPNDEPDLVVNAIRLVIASAKQ
jgi:pimeloyl-ACP methyl ester carboxylesterase